MFSFHLPPLCFAYKEIRDQKLEVSKLKNLNWLGILLFEDPVREGVSHALAECRKAGIKEVHVHSLRHTFCSMAHMRGIHETAIQAVLGHKSSAMTRRYRHLRPDYLQEQFRAFGYGNVPDEEENNI